MSKNVGSKFTLDVHNRTKMIGNIQVREDEHAVIKSLSKLNGVPMSEIVRQMVTFCLTNMDEKHINQIKAIIESDEDEEE